MTNTHKLYGMAGSLYTGKVRAYLRRNHIPFTEHKAGGERFNTVVRKAVGRWIIPVIETPDGEFIQDGTDILDHFENKGASRQSIYPKDVRLRIVAHLFELFGGEGLLRPAMHYRWNFDDDNLHFLTTSFEDVLPNGLSAEERQAAFLHASGRMRKAAVAFGVKPETFETIQDSYAEFLSLMNAHLVERPYLLGGHPTVGDYGLFGPLYPHLARDPKPLHLMQTHAPRVHRWTERMNMPETFVDEATLKAGDQLNSADDIPNTLKAMMRFVAEDYLPELSAHIVFTNEWLKQQSDETLKQSGPGRSIGMAEFEWRGHTLSTAVMPYRNYLLQRLHAVYDEMDEAGQNWTRALFADTGLSLILDLRSPRKVVRKDHLEAWA
jgi:glutathione S-transferase